MEDNSKDEEISPELWKGALAYVIESLMTEYKEAITEKNNDVYNEFKSGRGLAYCEVMDIIKNRLIASGIDAEMFGLTEETVTPD